MPSLSRIFIVNKFMAIMFAVALAVSLLYSSTITLSSLYVEESITKALKSVEQHAIMGFIGVSGNPFKTISTIVSEVNGVSEIKEIQSLIIAVKYRVTHNITISSAPLNKTIILPENSTLVVVTGVSEELAQQPPIELGLEPRLYYKLNVSGRENITPTGYSYVYGSIAGYSVRIFRYYELSSGNPLMALWSSMIGCDVYSAVAGHIVKYYYTTTEVHIEEREIVLPGGQGTYYAVLYLPYGSRRAELLFETIAENITPAEDIYVEPAAALPSMLALTADEKSFVEETFDTINGRASFLAIAAINFDLSKVVYGYSIDASVRRISEVYYRIARAMFEKGVAALWYRSDLVNTLMQSRFQELITRLVMIVNIIPSFIVIWIISSRLPPVIISVLRKVIALTRIRGVGVGSLKKAFTGAVILWSLVGLTIGFILGPVYGVVLFGRNVSDSPKYIQSIATDVYTIVGLAVFAVIAILLSLHRSFKILSSIAPREFTRPTVLAELPMVERGMGRGSWLMLILGIYYVVKTAVGFSPVLYMTQNPPSSPALMILLIILAIIEPIVSFFGPIFFIYGIAKLLVAYPDKMTRLVNSMVRPFVGELRHLVSRLLEVKPARITVSIMMIGFAVGILLSGIIGEASVSMMFDNIRDVAYGTDYYLYTISGINETMAGLQDIISSGARHVDGDYTPLVLYAPGGLYIRSGNRVFTVDYIFFIDPDSFEKLFRTPGGLGVDRDAASLFRSLGGLRAVFVADPESSRPEAGSYRLSKMIAGGMRDILDVDIIGSTYNIPGILPLMRIATAAKYGGVIVEPMPGGTVYLGAGAYIPVPTVPNILVLSIDECPRVLGKIYSITGVNENLAVALATNNEPSSIPEGEGWRVFRAVDFKEAVDSARDFMLIGAKGDISSGLALYTTSLIAVAILAYSSIHENLYAFTLLRARGVRSGKVMKIAVGEGLVISMLGVIPGIILGVVLGINAGRALFQLSATPLFANFDKIYGIGYTMWFSPETILAVITAPLVVIVLSLVISYATYRRVLREALVVLGSHV